MVDVDVARDQPSCLVALPGCLDLEGCAVFFEGVVGLERELDGRLLGLEVGRAVQSELIEVDVLLVIRSRYSSRILLLEEVRAAPDGQHGVLVPEEVGHVELLDGFFEFEREVDLGVGLGDEGGVGLALGEVLLVGAGLAAGRALGLRALVLVQQLQLFECLHDGPQLGRSAGAALLDALAGGLPRDGLLVRVWEGGLAQLDGAHHALELVAGERGDAHFFSCVEAGHGDEGHLLGGLRVLLVRISLFFIHDGQLL